MNREPVISSHLASVAYEGGSKTLEVEFKGGGVYEYLGVPQQAYDDLRASPSLGRHFSDNVRGKYPARKLR